MLYYITVTLWSGHTQTLVDYLWLIMDYFTLNYIMCPVFNHNNLGG